MLLALVFSLSCYAQLSKFQGTWISKDQQMCEIGDEKFPMADRMSIFRFDVDGKDVHVRHKINFIFFETKVSKAGETTHYFTIKNVVVNENENTIECDIYNPPEMGKTYIGKYTPKGNMPYDKLVEHSKHKFKVSNVALIVETGPTIREFYYKQKLVETDKNREDDYIYRLEYYREGDNW